jgi:hypothetical protein
VKCVDLVLQADGSYAVFPVETTDFTTCNFVLQTGAEVGNSLFNLSPAQGLEISMYVCALWATAWGIKQIAKVLNSGDSHNVLD